jgi:hypothetical protein
MEMNDIPFGVTDWSQVEAIVEQGETGTARWRTREFGDVHVHMAEYSPGYRAAGWCTKGHILLCVEGELHTELQDGRKFVLTPGISYQVADRTGAHRSSTQTGARLFLVD